MVGFGFLLLGFSRGIRNADTWSRILFTSSGIVWFAGGMLA
jgi:hypothetical protein